MFSILLLSITVCFSAHYGYGLMFELNPNGQRCLRDQVEKDTLIVGEFSVTPVSGQVVHYIVRDMNEHILAKNDNVSSGRFTFSTETPDVYEICFMSRLLPHHKGFPNIVRLDIKSGVEAKTYDALIESGKLKPMEVELKKIEDLCSAIVKDFENMRHQEIRMRNTNESTNTRMFYLSIFSMLVLITISVWQIFYLRRYFKSRKLID